MSYINLLVAGAIFLSLPSCISRATSTPSAHSSPEPQIGVQETDKSTLWQGTRLSPDGQGSVTLRYQQTGGGVTGEFGKLSDGDGLMNPATVEGVIVNDKIRLELTYPDLCVYTVAGSIIGERLVARAEPTRCPGGTFFELDLRKS